MSDHGIAVKTRLDAGSPRLAHAVRQGRIAHEVANRSSHESGVANRNQDSRLAVVDDFGSPWGGGGDHWLTKSHRLQHHVGQSLVSAGQDDQVCRGQQPRHIITVPEKSHSAVQMIRMSGFFEPIPQWAVARNQGTHIRLNVLDQIKGFQEVVDALLLGEAPGEENQGAAGSKPNEARTSAESIGGGSSSPAPE